MKFNETKTADEHSLMQTEEPVRAIQKKRKRYPFLVTVICFTLLTIVSGCSTSKQVETINVAESSVELDVNKETTVELTITPDDAKISSIDISADKGVEAVIDGDKLNIKSLGNEGIYEIELISGQVSSKISVSVVDKTKREVEAKAKKEAEDKAKKEAEDKAKKEAEDKERIEAEKIAQQQAEADAIVQKQAEADAIVQKQADSQQQSQGAQTPIGNEIYIAGSGNGTKYHSHSSCSNMKNPVGMTVADAKAQGYSACKKCY